MPLHPSRRTAVIEWAQRTGGYVLDDDYDGEFRYDRQPVGALQALSPDRVAYMGSTSKSLTQTLRLGWIALPDELIEPVVAAMGGEQFYVDAISQLTMADFIRSGQYDRHIRRMRTRYRARRDALVDALTGFDVGIRGLAAGVNVLLTLPEGKEHEVLRRAGEAGIALHGMSRMRHPDAGPDLAAPDGIIVGFAAAPEHSFAAAVDALCGVLRASGLAG
jgi:GntR family transcriptional regulator/MocR family aminotransferase